MPDITLCTHTGCPLALKCYRFMAEPNLHRQSFSYFLPNRDGTCDYYMPWERKDEADPGERKERL